MLLEECVCYDQCIFLAKLYLSLPCFIPYSKAKFVSMHVVRGSPSLFSRPPRALRGVGVGWLSGSHPEGPPRRGEPQRLPLGLEYRMKQLAKANRVLPRERTGHSKHTLPTTQEMTLWRIPGTGEPGGLPSIGSHRVGHD